MKDGTHCEASGPIGQPAEPRLLEQRLLELSNNSELGSVSLRQERVDCVAWCAPVALLGTSCVFAGCERPVRAQWA
eukprot:1459666-Alexandrium_andersonii.AAC.1